jgi:predicted TIM-barrel fold metal-dependent hydrolase
MTAEIIDARVRLPRQFWPKIEVPAAIASQYDAVLGTGSTKAKSFDDLLGEMEANGVGRAVMHAEFEVGDPADAMNDAVAAIVKEHGGRFLGVGGVSLEHVRIRRVLDQVDRCRDAGFVGIGLQPAFFGMSLDDRRLYPLYAHAERLGLIVFLHTGVNYSRVHPMRHDQPLLIDDIACDFPELKIVACHAGWPWVSEMVAVARKHPTVFLEFGGLAPKYLGTEGTGWEVMFRFMNSLLGDQILYGTDWPVIGMERAVGEWKGLGLKEQVLDKALAGNARRLFQL